MLETKMNETKKSAGGIARANALTQAERSEIAQKAAEKRWSTEIVLANYGGTIKFGEVSVDCYVTDNGCRVISGRGLQDALMLTDNDKSNRQKAGSRIPRLLTSQKLKPLFEQKNITGLFEPIKCQYKGRVIHGYDANVIADICSVMYEASTLGLITTPRLKIISQQCVIVFSAFAKVGITALIDEATGYQEIRHKDELQKILDKYLTDYAQKWSKTFPDEFWIKLLRVKGFESYVGLPRPQFVGHWVNDIVYARLAPGILEELKKRNPRTKTTGNRRFKHTQFLSEDQGVQELKEYLLRVIGIMDVAIITGQTGDNFDVLLNKIMPKYNSTLEIPC